MYGKNMVPLVGHVLILLLGLGQGQQLDGGGEGEGDVGPGPAPGGVVLAGGGEDQVTILYQIFRHDRLHCYALKLDDI